MRSVAQYVNAFVQRQYPLRQRQDIIRFIVGWNDYDRMFSGFLSGE